MTGLRGHEVEMKAGKFEKVDGTDFEMEADLVLLAMGFTGPEREGLLTDLSVEINERGNVARDAAFATSVPGVYVAGDMGRGQSLIVWAIAEGRAAAAGGGPLPRWADGAACADQAHRRAAALDSGGPRRVPRVMHTVHQQHPSLQSQQKHPIFDRRASFVCQPAGI